MSIEEFLRGRKLLRKEIPEKYHSRLKNNECIFREQAMTVSKTDVLCGRCQTRNLKETSLIKNKYKNFYYCSECIEFGRVESHHYFYSVSEKECKRKKIIFNWEGKLTADQAKISKKLVVSYKENKNHLVHAVTGAGKTEMLFELLRYALEKGHRIAVASPRVDVCLEIFPRFQTVFPEETIALLYGRKEQEYYYTSFVVSTTHQLLRFSKAFDLIIVDEVDAFPYADNPVLERGTKNALKQEGNLVYLTATPSNKLIEKISKKELEYSELAKRYHGYRLPTPTCHFDYFLVSRLEKGRISKFILKILNKQERQCLIFFPNIEHMRKCFCLLQKKFPEKRITIVYANEENREEKVKKMRNKQIDWLLTTTILERGITIENLDVIVFEAHHRSFTKASLVQISGRVGRKKEHPTGNIYFLHSGKTQNIKEAVKEIDQMNERAGFK